MEKSSEGEPKLPEEIESVWNDLLDCSYENAYESYITDLNRLRAYIAEQERMICELKSLVDLRNEQVELANKIAGVDWKATCVDELFIAERMIHAMAKSIGSAGACPKNTCKVNYDCNSERCHANIIAQFRAKAKGA